MDPSSHNRPVKPPADRPATPKPKVIRVVLVDDHDFVRSAIRLQLQWLADIDVAGEAGTGREAVVLVKSTRPELVLMDIMMPEMDGLQATEIIAKECPDTRVIILSSCQGEDWKNRALKAGASAYLVKGAPLSELEAALRKVLGGKGPPG